MARIFLVPDNPNKSSHLDSPRARLARVTRAYSVFFVFRVCLSVSVCVCLSLCVSVCPSFCLISNCIVIKRRTLIGQLHDDVVFLQLPESFSLLFSCEK